MIEEKGVCLGLKKLWEEKGVQRKKRTELILCSNLNPFSVSMWKCKWLTWLSFVFS